jgi:hypothetical protein
LRYHCQCPEQDRGTADTPSIECNAGEENTQYLILAVLSLTHSMMEQDRGSADTPSIECNAGEENTQYLILVVLSLTHSMILSFSGSQCQKNAHLLSSVGDAPVGAQRWQCECHTVAENAAGAQRSINQRWRGEHCSVLHTINRVNAGEENIALCCTPSIESTLERRAPEISLLLYIAHHQ